ncbi:MAG: hypothetical protein M8858_02455 [marine benthic group bacterium]|nr:hypothetical protein [Gemmatimonadota bacterium]
MNSARSPRVDATRPAVGLSISIDTEEDNWDPAVEDVTVRNIDELRRLDDMFGELDVRATYFVTYQVAADPGAAAIVRGIHEGGAAEIGAHLHPWNTPPLLGVEKRVSMLRDYPADVQQEKLESLLAVLESSLGLRPTSFRAGRFGVGRATIEALIENEIHIDSSVTPLLTWESQGGPSFIGAPNLPYRLAGGEDVRSHSASGTVVEVPVTVGFTRFPPESWSRIARLYANPLARTLHLPGAAYRIGLVQRVILTPETYTANEMLRVSRRFLAAGAPYLHMYLHSSSLMAGLTPFGETQERVDGIYARIRDFVTGLREIADVRMLTVSEAAYAFDPLNSRVSEDSVRVESSPRDVIPVEDASG